MHLQRGSQNQNHHNISSSKRVKSATNIFNFGASRPQSSGSMAGTTNSRANWVSPFSKFKREGLRSQGRARGVYAKLREAEPGHIKDIKKLSSTAGAYPNRAGKVLPTTLNNVDDATLQSFRQTFYGLPLDKQLELLRTDGAGGAAQATKPQLVLNTQTG